MRRVKNSLYRIIGMKVGKNVSVGLMAMFDIFFPELIEIGDNTIIGYSSTVLAHEYMVKEWGKGKVVIGNDVTIGANVTILAGVVIGDGATVSACSLVNRDVPENSFVGGIPIKPLK
jgi:acetyltransferase-like isoleucine patch superfamily enzyme